jgi:hypothetical protein
MCFRRVELINKGSPAGAGAWIPTPHRMAHLRVVRFKKGGTSEYCELALFIPFTDSTTKVIYGDREVTCDTRELCKAHYVHVNNMLKKATVFTAAVRDGPALRNKLPDYQDVRRTHRQSPRA